MNKEELRIPLNLQFFGDADTGTEDQGTQEGTDSDTGKQGTDDQNQSKAGASTTTYTQEDLNKIGKQEKESGRKSTLKALGFEDDKTAKAELDGYRAWKEAQKTDAEKTAEQIKTAAKETQDAKNEAALLKNTLALVKLGVAIESVDDVLVLALPKVNETTPLNKVVEAMKKEAKYTSLFTPKSEDKGTGNSVGSQTGSAGNTGSAGERLGKQANATSTQKSSYFSSR